MNIPSLEGTLQLVAPWLFEQERARTWCCSRATADISKLFGAAGAAAAWDALTEHYHAQQEALADEPPDHLCWTIVGLGEVELGVFWAQESP